MPVSSPFYLFSRGGSQFIKLPKYKMHCDGFLCFEIFIKLVEDYKNQLDLQQVHSILNGLFKKIFVPLSWRVFCFDLSPPPPHPLPCLEIPVLVDTFFLKVLLRPSFPLEFVKPILDLLRYGYFLEPHNV